MKILIIGADGFIGRGVHEALAADHDVYGAVKDPDGSEKTCHIDLLQQETIVQALKRIKPEVVINCAGIVDNSEKANVNALFTGNLLEAIVTSSIKPTRIIIVGSAAEYGTVAEGNIPVSEETPLNANSGYGLSKLKETSLALEFGQEHHLPVVVARIFNPIGAGMHPRFLIPSIIKQIRGIQEGVGDSIEVSRLDAKRDYVAIKDVATAIRAIVVGSPSWPVYNIGSGKSTSNSELIDLIIRASNLPKTPKIIQTSTEPESLIAIRADITRIGNDLGWKPVIPIEETVKEIIDASKS